MESNASDKTTYGHLTSLSVEKLGELNAVLASILALPVARNSFAQIIDGKPTRTPYSDDIKAHKSGLSETIIVGDDTEPSDGAVQKYEEIKATFTPQDLMLDSKLAQRYQNALPGSHEHRLRLLEITAASIHAFAANVFTSFHRDVNIRPPKPREGYDWQFRSTDQYYVNFYHTNYRLFEHYPFGLLNVVGYWIEAELFGGVVLFERGQSDSEIVSAFLHPQKNNYAFQLSPKQLDSFVDLGIAGDAAKNTTAENLLPFAKEPNARVEPTFVESSQPPLRIYKNIYDQPPRSISIDAPSCVPKEGDPWFASFENTFRIAEERGWLKRSQSNPRLS